MSRLYIFAQRDIVASCSVFTTLCACLPFGGEYEYWREIVGYPMCARWLYWKLALSCLVDHLLATQQNCSRCSVAMRERPRADVSDGWCPTCKTRKSIRSGSFFEKSHITLQKWLLLLHLWSREYAVTRVSEDVGIDSSTACDVYQWLREVCSTKLLHMQIVLGGQNATVQIDESLFRHKPKVKNDY